MLCHLFSFVDFSIIGVAVVEDGDFLVVAASFLVLLLIGVRFKKELSAMSATANEGFK